MNFVRVSGFDMVSNRNLLIHAMVLLVGGGRGYCGVNGASVFPWIFLCAVRRQQQSRKGLLVGDVNHLICGIQSSASNVQQHRAFSHRQHVLGNSIGCW